MEFIEIVNPAAIAGPAAGQSSDANDALDALLKESKGFPRSARASKAAAKAAGTLSPHLYSCGPYLNASGTALGGVYWAPKDSVPKAMIELLTVEPQTMPNQWASKIKCYYVHKSKPDVIGIPRFFGLSAFGKPAKDIRVTGNSMAAAATAAPAATAAMDLKLRPLQSRALKQTLEVLETWGGATIVADCGFGKTRLAVAIAASLGLKTMVLCNREVLMLQWASVIKELTPWRVSWLQGSANFERPLIKTSEGHLLGPAQDSDVCIASIDTLIEGHVPKSIIESFGLIIVDEAHHLAAASLVHALPLLPARYVVCLSATPDRRDGLEHVLYWLGGPVSFVYKRLPSITGIRDSVLVRKIEATNCRGLEKMYANGTLAFAEMLTALTEDPRRNKIILDALVDLVTADATLVDRRKKIIVVSALVAHCQALKEAMAALAWPDMQPLQMALMAGPNIESVKAKDPETRIVFATYSLLEEGYDDPVLDTLVLATPRSRIQQTVGRIERTLDGKLRPMVLDVVDLFSVYPNMWNKRKVFYKSRGFEISF
jgi:superfamily II DNA or RNA helicase